MNYFSNLISKQKNKEAVGIYSVCSSNSLVIESALRFAKEKNCHVLIESTSNQVNQYGGYTGMLPLDFYQYVKAISSTVGFDSDHLILGGDHLGPNPFADKDSETAMVEAEEMIRQYVKAGFTKIHVDCSMRLGGDSLTEKLSDQTIAKRSARLIKVAEESYTELLQTNPNSVHPVYVVGSEVPIPGGALEHEDIQVTSPEDLNQTITHLKAELKVINLEETFKYVIAVVVQPGVEFGSSHIDEYQRENAKALTTSLDKYPSIVFEGHSTDYQTPQKLKEMVEDGIGILKVGPQLTFALREALFALAKIEEETSPQIQDQSNFVNILLSEMENNPKNYAKHYHGDIKHLCKYSLLDRARYYLGEEKVDHTISKLISNLEQTEIELTLLSQYLPVQYQQIRTGKLLNQPKDIIFSKINEVYEDYYKATNQN